AVHAGRLQHVRVDEDVVTRNVRMVAGDVPDPTHVRGEVVDLVHAAGGHEAVVPAPQVEQLELVCGVRLELWFFDVGPPHPVAVRFQVLDQVMAYEAARAGDQSRLLHRMSP